MMAGRRPKPTALKLLAGNPGCRPVNSNEPEFPLKRPDPPDFLRDEALEEWERMVEKLSEVGMLTEADRGPLAAYCAAYGRWAKAEKAILKVAESDPLKSEGLLNYSSSSGRITRHPLVDIADRALRDLLRCGIEFGLTPSSRSRVVVSRKQNKANPFAEHATR